MPPITSRPDVWVKTERDLRSLEIEYQRALGLHPDTLQHIVQFRYHTYFDAEGKVLPGGFTFERRRVLRDLLHEAQRLSENSAHKTYAARLLSNITAEMRSLSPT